MTSVADTEHHLGRVRLLPIVVLEHADDALPLADALTAGGVDTIEITLRTEAGLAAIGRLAELGHPCIGAGTVLTVDDADRAVAAGARFILAPGLSAAVVQRGQSLGVPVFPGVATATEIHAALELGCTTVKFFPAGQLGGPAAIRALAAPFAGTRFIPTGGVNPGNLTQYLAEPAVLAVGGSWLVAPDLVRARAWGEITRLAQAACDAVAA
jgi:2-dehydro-3-deoxyphosphogluconate aldolase/(4S)-4-hydroxy-2-oxoglutarate aldolase